MRTLQLEAEDSSLNLKLFLTLPLEGAADPITGLSRVFRAIHLLEVL